MADVFLASGYRTGAIYSWVSLDPQFSGLNHGFQTYDGYVLNRSLLFSNPNLEQLAALYRQVESKVPIVKTVDANIGSSDTFEKTLDGRADVTNAAVFNWLDAHASGGPFFLWVHYFDPHYPYTPPPGYDHVLGLSYSGKIDGSVDTIKMLEDGKVSLTDADRARLGELYQGEIAFTDYQIGRLIADLSRRGILDDTIVALTGDHGESFGEHGDWVHGTKVFETEIRVPLLIRYPRRVPAGVAVGSPVQLVDVMPTLLELTGLRAPKPVQGTSLLPFITRAGQTPPGTAFVELADEAFVALLTADWKLIRNNANGELQLYRLSDDEAELRNLVRTESRTAQDLAAQLQEKMKVAGVSK
jgi:arylsulfatase A-like enzyme